jgi:acyl-CoA reductase-like NAD-dependent aldehyde dehydrogenase
MERICSILMRPDRPGGGKSSVFYHRSPKDTQSVLYEIESKSSDVQSSVDAANGVFQQFGRVRGPRITRDELELLLQSLHSQKERFFAIANQESGRTKADFNAEFAAVMDYVRSVKANHSSLSGLSPRGVCVLVGSSIWPIFYGLQFTLSNLLIGNPVIIKPSERTTRLVLEWVSVLRSSCEWFEFLQVVVGERDTGRQLVCHSGVDIVIFQGSYEVGMRIRQDTIPYPGKEVLLFLGAKNAIVLDTKITPGVRDLVIRDAFLGAGQNCLNAPLIFVESSSFDQVCNEIAETVQQRSNTISEDHDLIGPLQDSARLERYLKFTSLLEREGAVLHLKGNRDPLRPKSCFVSPTVASFRGIGPEQIRKYASFQGEFPGPHLTMIAYRNLNELAHSFESLSYGHSCGYWGEKSSEEFEFMIRRHFGRFFINKSLMSIDAWSSPLSRKRSGNHARLGSSLFDQLSAGKIS